MDSRPFLGDSVALQPPNSVGLAVCLMLFFVHFLSFALQETIGTPLVQELYGWGPCEDNDAKPDCNADRANYINLLYTGSGVVSWLASVGLSFLSRSCSDVTLLFGSVLVGLAGAVTMLDVWDGGGLAHGRIGVAQFLVGFTLVSIAFPIGRNVTLSVASKIVGPHPQVRVGSLVTETRSAVQPVCFYTVRYAIMSY